MNCEFDVNMKTSVLYDYSMYHTYRGLSGILGTIVGILLIVNYLQGHSLLYLIFGIIVVFYLPVGLFFNAKKQMAMVENYKSALHYKLSAEGIEVSQGEVVQVMPWDGVIKAVSTQKSIILYTGRNIAIIFPREDLGEQLQEVLKIISENMEPKRVKIRF